VVYAVLTNEAIMTTEIIPMQDLSNCNGKLELTNKRFPGIARR